MNSGKGKEDCPPATIEDVMARLDALENVVREVEVTTAVVEDQVGTLLARAYRQEEELRRQAARLQDLVEAAVARGLPQRVQHVHGVPLSHLHPPQDTIEDVMARLDALENVVREVEVTTAVVEDQVGTLLARAYRQEDEMERQVALLQDLVEAAVARGLPQRDQHVQDKLRVQDLNLAGDPDAIQDRDDVDEHHQLYIQANSARSPPQTAATLELIMTLRKSLTSLRVSN